MLMKLTPGVNFINVKRARFGSFFLRIYVCMYLEKKLPKRRSYEIHIRTFNVDEIDPGLDNNE